MTQQNDMPEIRIGTLKRMIVAHMKTNIPLFVHGSPGTVKSAVIMDTPNWAENHFPNQKVVVWDTLRLSQVESIDLRGLVMVSNGKTVTMPPEELPLTDTVRKAGLENAVILWFLDELGNGVPSTQAAFMQLVHERRIGKHRLADNVRIVCATNLASDRTGVSNLLGAFANRATNVILAPSFEEWVEWAEKKGNIRWEIVKFLKMKPGVFYRYDRSRIVNTTARSWERVSVLLDQMVPREKMLTPDAISEDDMMAVCRGNLDSGAATEFMGFCSGLIELIGIEKLFVDPMKAPVPKTNMSVCYLLSGIISWKYKPGQSNIDNMMAYIARIPAEFQALVVKDLTVNHPSFKSTPQYAKWCVENPGFDGN